MNNRAEAGIIILGVISAAMLGALFTKIIQPKSKPAPMYAICSVDDTIVFTAAGANKLAFAGNGLTINYPDRPPQHRVMLPNETCGLEEQYTPEE